MFKELVLLLAVVAVAHGCSTLQRLKVKAQWTAAFGEGKQRTDFGTAVWKAVFAQDPQTVSLFKRVKGDQNIMDPMFIAHSRRVLGGLDQCISLLDDADTLNAQLLWLRAQHRERGIPSNYFDLLGNAIMQVVPAQLGRCFDLEAWQKCYNVIAGSIKAY